MTKKFFFNAFVFCLLTYSGHAQYTFVVQNGTASVFKTLNEAYTSATAGDTIYLPGGSFTFPPQIDKSLVWYGVGYHPDSTESTYYTRINNNAVFSGNTDNTCISGIHFEANVGFGSNGNEADNISIHRCRIIGSLSLRYNAGVETDINTHVSECIIDGNIDALYGSNVHIEKSILRGYFYRFRSSLMENNIITLGGRDYYNGTSYCINDVQNCLVINSIFNYNHYSSCVFDRYNNQNNRFENNIFAGTAVFPDGTNTGSLNLTTVDLSTVFEHIEGDLFVFSFLHDFHLKNGSPAIGSGTGGIDMGIYGPESPFKTGGLPAIPHIRSVSIDQKTSNGMLHLEIEAASQDF
jgi:hypothetical protein